MTEREDTRRSPRIPCDLPMEYHIKGERPRDGRITKIGTVGALLAMEDAVPLGAELVLPFVGCPFGVSEHFIKTLGAVMRCACVNE